MSLDDADSVERWLSVSQRYADFAYPKAWEFLQPMIELSAWVGEQSFAAQLYPSTSHEWLCVHLLPGYNRDQPFFACVSRADKQFECHLLAKSGHSLEQRLVSLSEARSLFKGFVDKLLLVNA